MCQGRASVAGRQSLRLAAVLLTAGSVFGCVTASGPNYSIATQQAGPPKAGLARVVVFAGSSDGGWPVKLDGEDLGTVAPGSFLYRDRPAGPHRLTSGMWTYPGESKREFTAAAGRTYYFTVRMRDSAKVAVIAGGFLGSAMEAAASGGGGPVDIIAVEETAARPVVAGLAMVGN